MKTNEIIWRMTEQLPDGHRLFTCRLEDGTFRHAIADNSGRTPEDTEDGILWLDNKRHLDAGSREMGPSIPLVNDDDEPSRTISDVRTILWLARELTMQIADTTTHGGEIYSVV